MQFARTANIPTIVLQVLFYASVSQTRSDERPETSNFMYILEVICRAIVKSSQTSLVAATNRDDGQLLQRRRQLARDEVETERLDRIRNSSK